MRRRDRRRRTTEPDAEVYHILRGLPETGKNISLGVDYSIVVAERFAVRQTFSREIKAKKFEVGERNFFYFYILPETGKNIRIQI